MSSLTKSKPLLLQPSLLKQVTAEKARRKAEKLRKAAEGKLSEFIRQGWHVLEPSTPLLWNWHIDAIADHVQAVLEDWAAGGPQRIQNLLINVPPGTAKSRIVSVFAPAWMWLHRPTWRAIFISGNPRVALRDSMYCREVIESDWYRNTFKPAWRMADDQNAKSLFQNTVGGFRMATSVGARITGDRADALFVDDPNDAAEAYSKAIRESINTWWDAAARNRVNDPSRSTRIGIMQRVHEEDWSGHVLKTGEWEHLCIPQGYDPSRARTTAIGWHDPRTTEGELMFEARFPERVLRAEKIALGSAGFAGQHEQSPMPADGGMFKKAWWRFWRYRDEPAIEKFEHRTVILERTDRFSRVALSVDCSFKKTEDSDCVAAGAWGLRGPNKFLLDLEWEQMGIIETLKAIEMLSLRWPGIHERLIEDKANGPAVIQMLRPKLPGLIPVEPKGGKESRAAATAPQVEAGNVFLPLHAPWRDAYINEHSSFPKGAHDDAVDQQSQLLLRWISNSTPYEGQPDDAPKRRE